MKNKIFCFLLIVAETLYYILFVDYFSMFLLVFTLCLIAVNLLAGLPGLIFFKVSMKLNSEMYRSGEPINASVVMKNKGVLPAVCGKTEIELENMLSGEKETCVFDNSAISSRKNKKMLFQNRHYGVIKCTVKRAKVSDLMGLISIDKAKRKSEPLYAITAPEEAFSLGSIETTDSFSATVNYILSQKFNITGVYDIREYRAGDSMSSIHWKLSAKSDGLLVKEPLENTEDSVIILFNFFGDIDSMDMVIDNLAKFSKVMLDKKTKFAIKWQFPNQNSMVTHYIESKHDFRDFLLSVLCERLPETGIDLSEDIDYDNSLLNMGEHVFFARKEGVLDLRSGKIIGELT